MAEENNIQQNISIKVTTNADSVASDVNQLSSAIENTTEAQKQNTTETKKQDEAYKSFKTQIREAQQELLKVSQIYGETSKEAVTAAKKVADLKDQMGFASDLVDKFNPDQKFKALGAATQVAATATSGLVSGMALFGDQSEETEKALLKVQAAMAFSEAISGLSNLGDQWATLKTVIAQNTILTKANGVATLVTAGIMKLFSGSVDSGSTSFKGLKLAISATGIGLLVTGLALVVNNFDSIKKVVLKVVPGLAAVGDTIMSIVNAVTDFVGITSDATREVDRMKANADASIALNKKFLAEHESQLDEFTKAKIEAKNKYNEAIKEDGADQIALGLELNRQLAKIEYSRGDEARKAAEDARKKAEEDRKRAAEDARKKREEEAKKRKEEEIARLKELRDAEQNALLELQDLNDKTEEEKLARQKERDLAEIEALRQKGDDVRNLLIYNSEKYALLEEELRQKRADEKAEKEKEQAEKDLEAQKVIDEAIVEQKRQVEDAKLSIASRGVALIASVFGKSKAIQKAAIIAENAIGIGKMIIDNNRANIGALATPQAIATSGASAAPVIALNNISTGIGIASSVAATVKALSAVGGGGGAGGGGQQASTPPAGTAPQVNFQTSSENQIATTIANNTNQQPPVQAYVVSGEVTTAQALDRNRIQANSF